MALIKFSTPPTLAGFFFCLALTRCRAFFFVWQRISHTQAFTAVFIPSMQLYRQRYKTAHRALQVRFRKFDPFHRIQYQTGKSGYNTACDTLQRVPDITDTPDAVQISATAYYNKV
jgi:hypothetical protein